MLLLGIQHIIEYYDQDYTVKTEENPINMEPYEL